MTVTCGAIKKGAVHKKILESFPEYTFGEPKEISYGIQFEVSNSIGDLGVLKIFENKHGISKIDFSGLSEPGKEKFIADIQNKGLFPKIGGIPLPQIFDIRNEAIIEQIKTFLREGYRINEIDKTTDMRISYCYQINGVTIIQWKTGRITIQGKPSEVSDNIVRKTSQLIADDLLKQMLRLHREKFKPAEYEEMIKAIKESEMEDAVSERVYQYLYEHDKLELSVTLKLLKYLKTHTLELENYSFLVRNTAFVFEGFLTKFFIELGILYESDLFEGQKQIRIGSFISKKGKSSSDFEDRFGKTFSMTRPYLGSKLDALWQEYRNTYMHSDPTSAPLLKSIKDAEAKIRELLTFMDGLVETFQLKMDVGDLGSINCIGIDESGKGDFFGPLVVASVYVEPKDVNKLISIGVMDSKKITSDKRIFQLEEQIKKICKYDVVAIGPTRYNELYDKFQNLNKMLAWGHARALENILAKVECKIAISDQFGDESFIENALMQKGKSIRLIQKPKAEINISVAAASILARAEFIVRMRELGTQLGVALPLGSSDPKIVEVAKMIKEKYGVDKLKEVVKTHFKTMENVL